MDEKPKCPDHPDAAVTSARYGASDDCVWVCLKCGKSIGPAPSRMAGAIRETFTYERDDQGELKD